MSINEQPINSHQETKPNKIDYFFAALGAFFASPFLLIGNLFLAISSIILNEKDNKYESDKIAQKWARKIVDFVWLILAIIFILIIISLPNY